MKKVLALLLSLLAAPAAAQTIPSGPYGSINQWGPAGLSQVLTPGLAGYCLTSGGTGQPISWSLCPGATLASLPTIATNQFYGNVSGAQAAPVGLDVNSILNTIGYDIARPPSAYSIIYKSLTAPNNPWRTLPPGTTGQVLTTFGGTAPPAWQPAASPALSTICTTVGAILYYDPVTAWTCLAPGASGTLLRSNGAAAPGWVSTISGPLTFSSQVTFNSAATYATSGILVNGMNIWTNFPSNTFLGASTGLNETLTPASHVGDLNTFVGSAAGAANTTGFANTLIGSGTGTAITTGDSHTCLGTQACVALTTGTSNTGVGVDALFTMTTGDNVTAIGHHVAASVTYGAATGQAVFVGAEANKVGVGGPNTVCVGFRSCYNSAAATDGNVDIGYLAGFGITSGSGNVIVGREVATVATTASNLSLLGYRAGFNISTGNNNTGIGNVALFSCTTCASSTALGYQAGFSNVSGSGNVFVGANAGYYETGSNAFYLDNAQRINLADEQAKALMYGVFAAAPASQTMNINALTTVTQPLVVNSNSATALTVGPNGATNPALQVDGSGASQAAGVKISGDSGTNVFIAAISSGAAANLRIDGKGGGALNIGGVSTGGVLIGGGGGNTTVQNPLLNSTGTVGNLSAPGGRLTLLSGSAVMPTSQTAKGTMFYDCYHGQNTVPYFNGTIDLIDTIAACEVSDVMVSAASAGQIVSGQVYDVWWVHGGANRICVAMSVAVGGGGGWAADTGGSSTARGTGYSQLDFTTRPYVTNKNSITNCFNAATNYGPVTANQGTYLGTFFATANGQTSFTFGAQGTAGALYVWNMYNRVHINTTAADSTANWTYTLSTPRQANASAVNQINFVMGNPEDGILCTYGDMANTAAVAGAFFAIGVALDSITSPAKQVGGQTPAAAVMQSAPVALLSLLPQTGLHYCAALEYSDNTHATTFFGQASQSLSFSSAM